MKRVVALLTALLMLVCATALAAEKVTLYTAEDGTVVTLDMTGDYTIEQVVSTDSLMMWLVSREGVAPIYVTVAPAGDIASANSLTDEELEAMRLNLLDQMGEENTLISVEVTPSGNKYFDIMSVEGDYELYERWTFFDGFEFNRTQAHEDGSPLTDEDFAFMDEVQGGMWVEVPAK